MIPPNEVHVFLDDFFIIEPCSYAEIIETLPLDPKAKIVYHFERKKPIFRRIGHFIVLILIFRRIGHFIVQILIGIVITMVFVRSGRHFRR